jgi:hypothetical protein
MRRWLLSGILPFALAGLAAAADPISPEQVDDLRALIKPSDKEDRWSRISWLTSLWQARQRAAKEGKPILLWEMDGHPLGCT